MKQQQRAFLTAILLFIILAFSLLPIIAQGSADLRIVKTADRQHARLTDSITYTITLTNLGPDTATNILFGDPVPDGLNLVQFSCINGTRNGPFSTSCLVTSLGVGETATAILVTIPIANLAKSERRIENTAFIASSDTPDPNTANNFSVNVVRITGKLG